MNQLYNFYQHTGQQEKSMQVQDYHRFGIWLARNELVFEQNQLSVDTMISPLNIRSIKWIQDWGAIKNELQQLWYVNQMGAFLLHCKRNNDSSLTWWNVEYVGFSDGAWKKLSNGLIKSGIGGVLINITKSIIFASSGNSKALNSLVEKKEAMTFLYSQLKASPLKKCWLKLFMYSMTFVELATRNKEEVYHINKLIEDEEWINLINDPFTEIAYVSRDFLRETYSLAKQGKEVGNMLIAWC